MSRRKKYKSKIGSRFIAIPYNMFESDAYKSLSSSARDILHLFKYRYNGTNNGEIHLTSREIRTWYGFGVGNSHSKLKELYEHGFIKPKEFGNFTTRKATIWVLTFETLGIKSPTNDWKNYDIKQNKVPNLEPYSSLNRTL